jgi:hypothetical protein
MRFLKGGVRIGGLALFDRTFSLLHHVGRPVQFSLSPIAKPSTTCDMLISDTVRNGNLELGSLKFWQQLWSGIQIVNGGADGSGFAAMSPKESSE